MKHKTENRICSALFSALLTLALLFSPASCSKTAGPVETEAPQSVPASSPSAGTDETAPEETAEEPAEEDASLPAREFPWPETKHTLRFGENGEFKILVFSDIHGNGSKISALAKTNIALLTEREDPDLVLLDGDNTWGLTDEKTLKSCVADITEIFEEKKIPWAHVYGNHDAENNNVKKEAQQRIYESFPMCVSLAGDPSLPGVGNYVLPVYASEGDRVLFNVWALDSGQYVTQAERDALLPVATIFQGFSGSVYDFIRPAQIRWYSDTSEKMEAYCGAPVPGLMAFHIPLQETYAAWVNRAALEHTGEKREAVCASEINSGLFAALLERGDVKAVVNGHDHVNDYMVNYGGIKLCYVSTVSETGYCDMDMLGARVFVVREEDPSDVTTYMTYVDERKTAESAPPPDADPFPSGAVLLDFDGYLPEPEVCGWDNDYSDTAEVERIRAEAVPDGGLNGSGALRVTRENFSASNSGNNAEAKIPLETPGKLGSNKYLRVWMDLTGDNAAVDFRKACFGLIVNSQLFSPYRTDDLDSPSPFWYLPQDGTEWRKMSHGGDGCFGAAQDSSVRGFKGWFAFPVENMPKRSSHEKLKADDVVTGVYFYFCLSDSSMKGSGILLDDIVLTEDYTAFD